MTENPNRVVQWSNFNFSEIFELRERYSFLGTKKAFFCLTYSRHVRLVSFIAMFSIFFLPAGFYSGPFSWYRIKNTFFMNFFYPHYIVQDSNINLFSHFFFFRCFQQRLMMKIRYTIFEANSIYVLEMILHIFFNDDTKPKIVFVVFPFAFGILQCLNEMNFKFLRNE